MAQYSVNDLIKKSMNGSSFCQGALEYMAPLSIQALKSKQRKEERKGGRKEGKKEGNKGRNKEGRKETREEGSVSL